MFSKPIPKNLTEGMWIETEPWKFRTISALFFSYPCIPCVSDTTSTQYLLYRYTPFGSLIRLFHMLIVIYNSVNLLKFDKAPDLDAMDKTIQEQELLLNCYRFVGKSCKWLGTG